MIRAIYNSWSGIAACQRSVELTAHNMANLNTPAYKRSEMVFGDMLYHEFHQRRFPTSAEQDLLVGQGVQLLARAPFLEQGTLLYGERPLDLAIEGDGYFRLLGHGEGELYTRCGSFQVDESGKLVTCNGDYLDTAVTLERGAIDLTIGPDGKITATGENGETVELGQLRLYRFPNPYGLTEVGSGCYMANEASGDPREGIPGENGFGRIRQYYLEMSNADIRAEMVDLLIAQRTLQANVRSLVTADELQALTLQVKI